MLLRHALTALATVATPASAQSFQDWPVSPTGEDAQLTRCDNRREDYTLEQAIAACDRLIEQSRNSPSTVAEYLRVRARHYELLGRADLAAADYAAMQPMFDDYVERNRAVSWAYVSRAAMHYQMGEYDRALADIDDAMRVERYGGAYANYYRGLIHFRHGDFAAALSDFDDETRIYGTSPDDLRRKCEVRAALQTDLREGLNFCNRAVGRLRAAPLSLISRGYYYFMAGDLDRALADFGRAANEAPHRAAAIYGRGVIALRQGRQAEGEADINAARAHDPREVAYYEAGGLRP